MSIRTEPRTATGLLVRPARRRADIAAFAALPADLRRHDPHRPRPMRRERRAALEGRGNPYLEIGGIELFLACRGARVVGRVAVAHRAGQGGPHGGDGHFGLFECAEDPSAAHALLDRAAAWLAERGHDGLTGPVGFTGGPGGLLVAGFDAPPAGSAPYNPAYYPALLESCGFSGAKDLWVWRCGPEPADPVRRIAAAVRSREGVTVRPLDLSDLDAEIARLREVYRTSWTPRCGLVPTTDCELRHLLSHLSRVTRPEGLLACAPSGEIVAFALAAPTSRRRWWQGLPAGIGALPFRRRATGGSAPGARPGTTWQALAFGVKEGFRGRHLEALLLTELWATARRLGCSGWETTWTLADNHAMNRVLELAGATRAATHRLYRRPL